MAHYLDPLNRSLGEVAANLKAAADHAERLGRQPSQGLDLSRLDGPTLDRFLRELLMHARYRPGT